jgi:hypothetical protein
MKRHEVIGLLGENPLEDSHSFTRLTLASHAHPHSGQEVRVIRHDGERSLKKASRFRGTTLRKADGAARFKHSRRCRVSDFSLP